MQSEKAGLRKPASAGHTPASFCCPARPRHASLRESAACARSIPRRDRGTALLCPFDPLVFFRPRVERLFDFHYRIEIYTPAPKRQYGYYVWPFLLDGRLVGRVDLKAERTRDALNVVGAFAESGQEPSRVAEALATELQKMASWLGLGEVTVGKRGVLTSALARALR